MDRLKAMRQHDWARVFGFGCVAVGLGMSVAGYAGAQWDALILFLGAIMLLRSAVDGPSPSRAAGLVRALRVALFMFAFATVNRAQGGVEGAVSGALANWVLWAVAALLVALPLARKGLPWGNPREVGRELSVLSIAAALFWLLSRWLEGDPDMAALRALVATAAVANGNAIWMRRKDPAVAGLAFGVMIVCVIVTPGQTVWPVAVGAIPFALGLTWLFRGRYAPES